MLRESKIISNILPDHYTVTPKNNRVHCKSVIGIKNDNDWDKFFTSLKQNFGERFKEVFHNTCTYHVDFSVYIDSNTNY